MKTKEELKLYFENGDVPVQEDFWEWQDSYWHKGEKLGKTSVDLLTYDEIIYSATNKTEMIGIGKKIIIPEGIKTIGEAAFVYPPVAKILIIEVIFPSTLEIIKARAFLSQYLTGTLVIPDSCKIIESNAFSSRLEVIETGAFELSESQNLTNLNIPDFVKTVGANAFSIPSLKTVSAPAGLDLSQSGIPETAVITYR